MISKKIYDFRHHQKNGLKYYVLYFLHNTNINI